VKSTDFGKATHGIAGEPMVDNVDASTVGASVSDAPSPDVAPDAAPTPVPGAGDPTTPKVRRKRGRPRDPEADGRILAAASSLILLRGFESMTVDEVASNAGVGKATVYRRWSRKEDLAVAAMEQLYHDEMPAPDTGSISGDLHAMFSSVLTFVNSPAGTDYVRTTIKESMRDERIATLYREANHRAESGAVAVFARGIARGEVREDVHIDGAVQFLGSLVAMRAITGQEMPGLDEVDQLVELLLHGISS
jgi:AcrR family transcriptional regulator